jgi:ribosomal protein S18 acetylase RimI-like enzyme
MNNYSFLNLNKSFLTPLAKFQVINNRYLNDNIWDENDLKSLIKHQYFYGKVCVSKEKILAFCLANGDKKNLELYTIFVDPVFRRLGIAKKILTDCISFCKYKKIQKIILEVSVKNEEAKQLYLKNNFEIYGLRKDYYQQNGEKVDALLMQLKNFM